MRLITMWAVRMIAAAVCIAALSACTTASQRPQVTAVSRSRPDGGPGHYVVVAGLRVAVRASADGRITGSVLLPGPAGTPRSLVAAAVFGGTDGQHFVIVVSRGGDLPGVADVSLFRLTVSPDGRPGPPSRLNFDSDGTLVTGAALSPDGKLLALSLVREFPAGPRYGSVELINVVTGATRTWTGPAAPGQWPGVPAWAADGTVMVPWWHSSSQDMIPASITGVRELDPVNRLLAARLVAFPAPVQDLTSAMIAPGGGDIIASSCRAGPGRDTATARIVELSAADGRLVRVLRTQTSRFPDGADAEAALGSRCRVLSVAGDGGQVLVQAFTFGRIGDGAFASLPGGWPNVLPVSAAW